MNDKQFNELLESVRDMGRHMRGEEVHGIRVQEIPEPDVNADELTGNLPTRLKFFGSIS